MGKGELIVDGVLLIGKDRQPNIPALRNFAAHSRGVTAAECNSVIQSRFGIGRLRAIKIYATGSGRGF